MFGHLNIGIIIDLASLWIATYSAMAIYALNIYKIRNSRSAKPLAIILIGICVIGVALINAKICQQIGAKYYQDLSVFSIGVTAIGSVAILIGILAVKERNHK